MSYSGNNHVSVTLKNMKQQKVDVKVVLENDSSENGVRKQLKDENNEAIEKRSKAQRVGCLFINLFVYAIYTCIFMCLYLTMYINTYSHACNTPV